MQPPGTSFTPKQWLSQNRLNWQPSMNVPEDENMLHCWKWESLCANDGTSGALYAKIWRTILLRIKGCRFVIQTLSNIPPKTAEKRWSYRPTTLRTPDLRIFLGVDHGIVHLVPERQGLLHWHRAREKQESLDIRVVFSCSSLSGHMMVGPL